MPTNLYGPGDNYHPQNSHVMASLIKNFIMLAKNHYLMLHVGGQENHIENFYMSMI